MKTSAELAAYLLFYVGVSAVLILVIILGCVYIHLTKKKIQKKLCSRCSCRNNCEFGYQVKLSCELKDTKLYVCKGGTIENENS